MQVAIVSIFRNSANGQTQRFLTQVAGLQKLWPGTLRVIAVHGDSTDQTAESLGIWAQRFQIDLELIERSHGGPVFGSTEHPERLRALSFVGNGAMEAVRPEDDLIWYAESDLIWDPLVAFNCLQLVDGITHCVAPLVFAGENFYDVFCFRGLDGQRFAPFAPYHSSLSIGSGLTEVSSVGSAFAASGEVARNCRMGQDGVLLGFFQDARERGYNVFVAQYLKVRHP